MAVGDQRDIEARRVNSIFTANQQNGRAPREKTASVLAFPLAAAACWRATCIRQILTGRCAAGCCKGGVWLAQRAPNYRHSSQQSRKPLEHGQE